MRTVLLAFLLLIQSLPAFAALSGGVSNFGASNNPTRVRQLAAQSGNGQDYSISETSLPNGTLVREFVRLDGIVFAVSWSGPFVPDLRSLLGRHFDTLTSETAKQTRAGRSQVHIARPDVEISISGHMRAYAGRAWVISDFPAGFTADDID